MSSYALPTPFQSTGLNQQVAQDVQVIPRYVQFTSPVSLMATERNGQGHANTLPLNIIARIVSYLDDIGDVSRVTRTSRLLYYMTLPQLYERVTLTSYAEIRLLNGRPEGLGGGSPLFMALNGLVTKSHAKLVREFRIRGSMRDLDFDDYASGRVPDSIMTLNMLTRVAVDRMDKLRSFSWEVNCKPIKTLYHGLSACDSLTRLKLKFSSSREPRPVVCVPGMPNLRAFHATDLDPLCYPDDLTYFMLESRKLEDLRLHFSPRMRAEAESSLSLDLYFARLLRSGRQLHLKHFGIQNWYAAHDERWEKVFEDSSLISSTFIDVFGRNNANLRTAFIDETWRSVRPNNHLTSIARCRCNEMSTNHAAMLAMTQAVEKIYWISSDGLQSPFTTPMYAQPTPPTPEDNGMTVANIGRAYVEALTQNHGKTLRHALLSDQWMFNADELGTIVRMCPNLEQLGFGFESSTYNPLRLLLPFLPNLYAIRLHRNDALTEHLASRTHEERMEDLATSFPRLGVRRLTWIGLGEVIYHIGGEYDYFTEDGTIERRRHVRMASLEEVQDVDIWAMDCMDLGVDPIVASW